MVSGKQQRQDFIEVQMGQLQQILDMISLMDGLSHESATALYKDAADILLTLAPLEAQTILAKIRYQHSRVAGEHVAMVLKKKTNVRLEELTEEEEQLYNKALDL